MRKSSLFHRKTLLSTSLMASLLIFPVIFIAVVPSILPASHGAPATVLAAPTIVDPTKTPPSTFYINITIADVSAMWGYQFFLYYDTKVLTATAFATYAPFNLDWNPALNDTAGYAFLAYSMKLGETVGFSTVTPKAIGRIDFSVDALGTSKLDLVESVLSDIFGNAITHTAQDGSFTNQAAVPDFSISASPTSKTIVQGGSGTSTITITSLNNFNSAVSLSITGLPTGATGTFSPASVTPPAGGSATSTLTINVGASTATGTYTLTVNGTSGTLKHSVNISLTVTPKPDFSISASPNSLTITQGSSGTSTITITSLNNFNSAVSLSITGLPTGATGTFSPTSVTPPAGGSATSTLTINVGAATPTGTVTLTVTGTSGTLTHSTTISLTVTAAPDFSIGASPSSLSIAPGGSGTSTITITSLNNFNSAVSLSITGLPTGTTGTFSPTSVTPPAGGSATSTLTINVGASTATGTYTLTVTGTGGGKTHSVQISLTVTAAPDFSISASPSSLTIVQGESGTSTITITSANGFNSAVSLSISGLPTGVTASFSPTSVTPPPDGSATSTLTINVDASTATGTYQLTVTGTSGTLEHSVTVSLTVTAPAVPDFSISASPTSLTIIRGNSGTSTITVTSLNGFSEAVSLSISGAPTGVTATLSPTSVTPPPDGSATSALTVSVDATAPTGSFTLIVTGTSGTLTHTVNIILIVQASFEVTIDTQTFIVLAVSNSTIEDFTFNQTLNQMNFTISGPPGTTGYLNVTIPKAVFPALPEQWTFLFDGSPITPTMTQNATHVFLSFTYVHSVHTITIMGGPIPLAPEVVSTDSSGNLKSNFQPSEEVWVKGTGFAADKDVTIHIIPYNTDPAQAEPGMSVANSTATTSSTGELPVTLAWSPPLTPGKYDIWVDANKNGVFDTGDAYNNVLISEYGFLVIPEPAIIVSALLMLGALATFYFTRKRKLH